MIFSPTERMIAFRYLRAKRREGFISVISMFSLLGIALGVATLIVVMAVMNGFRIELSQKILGLGGHVSVYSFTEGMRDFEAMAERLSQVEGVVRATPLITGQTMVVSKYETSGALVRAMRVEDLAKRDLITSHVVSGAFEAFGAADTVVMGARLAERLGVSGGDTLTLMSPKTQSTILGSVPRLKTFRVAATVETGLYDFDNNTIFMPLAMGQIFFRLNDAVNEIELMLTDPYASKQIRAEIGPMVLPYDVQDWQMKNAALFSALQVERSVMFLILTLIVVVAAFNIISGLVMLVNDKGRDIAILRTMGASRGAVMRVFFMCGAAIGVSGTFLGLILGVSFATHIEEIRRFLQTLTGLTLFDPVIYFLSELPAHVVAADVINVTGMALILSLLATLYPAWKAAKMNPAEALRYE